MVNKTIGDQLTKLFFRYQKYFGNSCALLDKTFVNTPLQKDAPQLFGLTTNMPMYARLLFGDERQINYHIGGYSDHFAMAFTKMLAEAIERYCSLMCLPNFAPHFVRSSWANLTAQNKRVLPLDYLNIYTAQQYLAINPVNSDFAKHPADEHTVLHWLPMVNWFDQQTYYVCTQPFFLAGQKNDPAVYNLAFTTGTACHETQQQALINALLEAIQLHDFMLGWYGYVPFAQLVVDDLNLQAELTKRFVNQQFTVTFWYANHISDVHTVVAYVKNSNQNSFPKHVFGLGCHFDLKQAVWNAAFEALAVFNFTSYLALAWQKQNHALTDLLSLATNLDDNVLLYACDVNKVASNTIAAIASQIQSKVFFSKIKQASTRNWNNHHHQLQHLLTTLKQQYKYLFVQDITTVEFTGDFSVVRAYLPEMLAVCFPSFFPLNHPALKNYPTPQIHVPSHPIP